MVDKAAKEYCVPEVIFNSRSWRVKGKSVLVIDIGISQTPPHKAPDQNDNHKVYVRIEDQNMLANGIQMKIWTKLNAKNNISFAYSDEAKAILNIIGNFESLSLNTILSQIELSRFKTENILAELIIMKVIRMEVNIDSVLFSLIDPEC
jgi:hypothetical protein